MAAVILPMLTQLKTELMKHETSLQQDTAIILGALDTRLTLLEKLISEKKKPASRPKATDATPAAPTADGAVAPLGAAAAAAAPVADKSFPANKLIYFREKIKADPAFYAKYLIEDVAAAVANDPTIAAAPERSKMTKIGTLMWNFIKDKRHDLMAKIEEEYKRDQAAHAAGKTVQLEAEAHTPPGTPAAIPAPIPGQV
jgi:hypothetical protein